MSSTTARRVVVAIPAKDEASCIDPCLAALAMQTRKPDAVLLLPNNCTDDTAAVAAAMSSSLPYRVHIHCREFPPPSANAGTARRTAMQLAAELAGCDGILLTTDADTVVADDWTERNLQAISAGADLVCGRAALDAAEALLIPSHLHADDALESKLTELLDRIAAELDPDPADPWPRHAEAAGASLAVTVAAFLRVGGIPAVEAGEDRAFVGALARVDARVRHDPAVRVTVSGRTIGRAPGGMADTIRRRIRQQDEFTDGSLEPSIDAYRRFDFRRRIRAAWQLHSTERVLPVELAADLGIPAGTLECMLQGHFFGSTWADIQAASPFLVRRRVRFTDLPNQIAYAGQLLKPNAYDAAFCTVGSRSDPGNE
jgi:glycosyltransferase involved in cell wall biosynthesis